ncbi:MAG: UDP-N-acetylmuramoyl-tripeptide--D-alanyl-D-alanine ligase [Bacteroidota bacterium]
MDLIEYIHSLFLRHSLVLTDSRRIEPNGIFFALKGPRFDGNQYALKALEQGAAYAVVDDPSLPVDQRLIRVENVLKTLQDLARYHRRRFLIPIIGITGSNGKTTTKELVAAVMGSHYRTFSTRGNLNNHIGVPLSLLSIQQDAEVAIIEMGANHQREIAALCEIAEPTHGLITNIGKAHLEGFGGIEGVKIGKGELFTFLTQNKGLAFINRDEPELMELSESLPLKLFYGQAEKLTEETDFYEAELLAEYPTVKLAFWSAHQKRIDIHSQLPGKHNFRNMMTAITIGKYFKVPSDKIKEAIEGYRPDNNRSEWRQIGENHFFLDAYNANPTSMRKGLEAFAAMKSSKKVAILGDMLEMGTFSQAEHEDIAQLAQTMDFDHLVLVGPEFSKVTLTEPTLSFVSFNQLQEWYDQQGFQGVTVFLKGSRGIGLERLLDKRK